MNIFLWTCPTTYRMTAIKEEVLDHENALTDHEDLAAHANCEGLSMETLDPAHIERTDFPTFHSGTLVMSKNCQDY